MDLLTRQTIPVVMNWKCRVLVRLWSVTPGVPGEARRERVPAVQEGLHEAVPVLGGIGVAVVHRRLVNVTLKRRYFALLGQRSSSGDVCENCMGYDLV